MPISTNCPHQAYCEMREQSDMRFISHLTRNTFAIILAGGRGTRLKQLTDFRSKPAVPFAGKFRILDFTLSNCVNSGIRKIGVATQYKAHSLIRHIQRGWSFLDGRFDEFIQLLPAQQQIDENQWYQGTADAVYQNLHFLRRYQPEHILVVAGDHIYKMDYGRMLAEHARQHADMTVACIDVPISEAREFGVMGVDEAGRVIEFVEKPQNPPPMPGNPGRALASMGIYIFNTRFLFEQLERDALTQGSSRDFGKDIIPRAVKNGVAKAHSFSRSCVHAPEERPGKEDYWRDAGTVDAYWEANVDLTATDPALNLYDKNWPIWTYQAQLPPAKFVHNQIDRHGIAIESTVSGGCIISGEMNRSLLFSSCRVHSYAKVNWSVLLPEVDIGRGARLSRCIVDHAVRIPAGMVIGEDPHEDARRFRRTDNGVTLVTQQMIDRLT